MPDPVSYLKAMAAAAAASALFVLALGWARRWARRRAQQRAARRHRPAGEEIEPAMFSMPRSSSSPEGATSPDRKGAGVNDAPAECVPPSRSGLDAPGVPPDVFPAASSLPAPVANVEPANAALAIADRGDAARLNAACILGIGLGLALGCQVLHLRVGWPPSNGLGRLLTIVFPAVMAVELIAGLARVPQWLGWGLRISLAAATGRVLLHDSVYLSGPNREWTVWQAGATLALCGGLLAAVWGLLSGLSRRSSGVSIPLALAQATVSAGIAVMLAGYISGGAAALPPAGALVGVALAVSLSTHRQSSEGAALQGTGLQGTIGIGVVGLFGLLFVGRFFGGISTGQALALFLAPLICWATELPMLRMRKPWLAGVLRLALVAIVLVIVLVLAKRDFDREMRPLLGVARTERPSVFSSRDMIGHIP